MMRTKIGDIIEIETAKGLVYAQYSHRNPQYGWLLRVFVKFFSERPKDFSTLVNSEPTFLTLFSLSSALKAQTVTIVGNVSVPLHAMEFPLFRAGFPSPATGKVEDWWFWDGEKEWHVGKLTPEQLKMPIRAIPNTALLVTRIEEGWLPENCPLNF